MLSKSQKSGLRAFLIMFACGVVFAIAARSFKPQPTEAAADTLVPLELILLVDTSASVEAAEYRMQNLGYARAFRKPEIISQIEDVGGVSICYIEWADANKQVIQIPWTHLKVRNDCLDFASTIQGLTRADAGGSTMMAPALEFAVEQLETNEFLGLRRVIDVSGDGACKNWRRFVNGEGDLPLNKYGTPWPEVMEDIEGKVHAINGVYIGDGAENLDFFQDVLARGEGSFALHAEDFGDFEEIVEQKILREITYTIPGTYD